MITSVHNKRVASAVRLKKRAMRERDRRFLVEGTQAVEEALVSGVVVEVVFHTLPAAGRILDLRARALSSGVAVHQVSEDVMARLTSTVTPQGVVAVAGFVDVPLEQVPATATCVPVLVEVRDPGNAGTIVRSADAAGADAVVFTSSSVDVYNEKTVRSTAGSLFHLPVVRDVPLERAVGFLRGRGMRVLAATADGEESIFDADLSAPAAVLFGNEAHGLSPQAIGLADATVRVPIRGRAESLNLAAAVAVVLFESARRRQEVDLAAIVSGAAHDLRSPIAALLGFGSTLLRRWGDLGDEQRRSMVEAMAHDAAGMRSLVTELVDAARIASGRLRLSPEPIDLLDAARRVAEELSAPGTAPAEVRGEPARALADPQRVHTILRALAQAAMWHGEEGPVRIVVRAADPPTVEVRRARAALDAAGAASLFAPAGSSGGGGSKAGLFVAHRLATAHGGSLEARVDGGIAFVLTLPPDRPPIGSH